MLVIKIKFPTQGLEELFSEGIKIIKTEFLRGAFLGIFYFLSCSAGYIFCKHRPGLKDT